MLLVLALLSCIVVFTLFGYMYYSVTAATARAIIARAVAETTAFDNINAEKIKTLYTSTQGQREAILKHLIPSTQVISFIEVLEAIGADAGSALELSAISGTIAKDVVPEGMGMFHARVNAYGSWQSMMRTLILAENLPYVTSVDSVHLETSSSDANRKAFKGWHISFDVSMLNTLASSSQQK